MEISIPKKKTIKNLPAKSFGRIEVIAGPMFSGKSTELMRRLERYVIAGKSIAYYVPDNDTRTMDKIKVASTRKQYELPVERIPASVTNCTFKYVDVVAFDEAQFFSERIITAIEGLRILGTTVIVSGLDTDFMRN